MSTTMSYDDLKKHTKKLLLKANFSVQDTKTKLFTLWVIFLLVSLEINLVAHNQQFERN